MRAWKIKWHICINGHDSKRIQPFSASYFKYFKLKSLDTKLSTGLSALRNEVMVCARAGSF